MRLIDADALKESITETLHRCDEWIENAKDGETRTIAESNYTAFLESILRVKDAPTIDAVPVVRCRDCKHHDPGDKKCDCGHAIQWQLPRDCDWFCADGERRDDDKSCDTCKHRDKGWYDASCDGCTKAYSNWERGDDE